MGCSGCRGGSHAAPHPAVSLPCRRGLLLEERHPPGPGAHQVRARPPWCPPTRPQQRPLSPTLSRGWGWACWGHPWGAAPAPLPGGGHVLGHKTTLWHTGGGSPDPPMLQRVLPCRLQGHRGGHLGQCPPGLPGRTYRACPSHGVTPRCPQHVAGACHLHPAAGGGQGPGSAPAGRGSGCSDPPRVPADLGTVQGGRARWGDRGRDGRAGHPVPGEGDHALRVRLRQRAPLQKVGAGGCQPSILEPSPAGGARISSPKSRSSPDVPPLPSHRGSLSEKRLLFHRGIFPMN